MGLKNNAVMVQAFNVKSLSMGNIPYHSVDDIFGQQDIVLAQQSV
jgi:hypothetical protein